MARKIEQVFGPTPYMGFDNQYIGGVWRTGRSGAKTKDIDPYHDKMLVEIPLADQRDVDEAYRSAAKEQRAWAATLPRERADMLRSVASILEARHDEIDREMKDITRMLGGTQIRGIVGNTKRTPLDECGHVYKKLDDVLEVLEANGIARVEHRMFPVANLKGMD